MATNKRLSAQTKTTNEELLENSEKAHEKQPPKHDEPTGKLLEDDASTVTPTTTVTTNSFLSSSVTTSTTGTTVSTKQYLYYTNLISSTLLNNLNDTAIKNIAQLTSATKEVASPQKDSERDLKPRLNARDKDAVPKQPRNRDVVVRAQRGATKEAAKTCKTCVRDDATEGFDKRFSSVLKGNYTTYRKKYLEGPVIGRGSFGVVRTLFSMVEVLDLYQYIPTRLRPPINNLAKGIKRLSANSYEFCGVSLTSPTRAAKIMNFERIKKTGTKNLLHILREVSIGSWNDHPNIVKVKEIYVNEELIRYLNNLSALDERDALFSGKNNNVYLVMEYCNGGDLSRLAIDEVDKEAAVPSIFFQVFRALSYINSKGIAHRDVKPENFLITRNAPANAAKRAKRAKRAEDIVVKLADFGLANSSARLLKTRAGRQRPRAGTPYYVAPEIIKCNGTNHYSVKCDSWSAGIMLHIFLLGSCPFHDESDVKKLSKVVNEEIDWTSEIYARIPPEAYDLLKKLLVKNPANRISTTDALHHVYFHRFSGECGSRAGYVPLCRNVDATAVIDKLIEFFKYPLLKQLALCIMIRQISEYQLAELVRAYNYLTSFADDLNTLDVNSLTKYTRFCNKLDASIATYNERIDKLYYLKESLRVEGVTFTEFFAAQMAPELCHNNDLIANVFAGLHSDLPGRRSLFINEHDLVRLTKHYARCHPAPPDAGPGGARHPESDALAHVSAVMKDACEYADTIYHRNRMEGNSHGLCGFLRSARGTDRYQSMSIDEFFLMMSFTPIEDYKHEDARQMRIKRKKMK